MQLAATSEHLALPELPGRVVSIDVSFDGRRIWSLDLSASPMPHDRRVPWPAALAPFLKGRTELVVRDSGSGEEFGRTEVLFDRGPGRPEIVDAEGIPLAINKWGRLGKTLEAGNVGVQERILDRTGEVIAHLQEMGLRPFVVGGTLLGAVREGALLPHDDDADIAYLSEHTNPADVAVEGFRVGHRLEQLGYELVRHSATHMQLYFRNDTGAADHYVDVFTAFFTEDGCINQPFHVRGPFRRDQMLPFSTVEIAGRPFPAPADPEGWLVINYDENWRTPIPGYRLATPRGTVRRFQSWFGSFHFRRDFWNDWYAEHRERADDGWGLGRDWLAGESDRLRSPVLIDLGSGIGLLSERLAGSGDRRVVATDFSHEVLRLAAARGERGGFETAHVNLTRTLSLAAPQQLGVTGAFDVVANHLFEQVGHLARANALRLIRMALRSGGTGLATLYGRPAPDVNFGDPTTWHMTRTDLAREAKRLGLGCEFFELDDASSAADAPDRRPYGVRFTLSDRPFPKQEESMRQRLKRLFLRARPEGTREAIDALTARVSELERELDEYRRDSLRVAELMDLAEQKLTPDDRSNQ